jgi:ABC-2 type transport system permease protein
LRPRFIWSFAKFDGISWIMKNPASIVVNIITPLCLLFIIYLLSNGRLVSFAVVGGIIAIVASSSLTTTGQSAMYRLEYRLQELIVATKVSIMDYTLGFTISSLVFCSPGIAFFTILGIVLNLFTWTRFATTLAVIFLLALATSSIALFAGTRIRRTIGMWAISGILSAVLTLIPPTFYPYSLLPTPVLYLLAISPVTPAAVALQSTYGLAPTNSWALPLLVFEAIFYMAFVRAFGRWREK